MKTLRRYCRVIVLVLALALPAFAGEMTTGIALPPPPPESQTANTGDMSTTITGEMSTGVTDADSVTTVVLDLVQSLLPLF